MIRLNASELTLTPAHVDETRRRMQRRQAANAPAVLPARFHHPSLPPTLRARLRRGPGRARHDSITTLGHVPIVRPQQAVHSSVHDPEASSHGLAESSDAVSSRLPPSPVVPHQTTTPDRNATATRLAVPLSDSELRLPLRPARHDRDSSPATSHQDTSEDTPSPSKRHLSPLRLTRARTTFPESDNDDVPLARHHASTDGYVDNGVSLVTPTRNQLDSSHIHSNHVPAPLGGSSRLEEAITG